MATWCTNCRAQMRAVRDQLGDGYVFIGLSVETSLPQGDLYGLLIGPMTLPCAGPIVVGAFLLGAGSFTALGSSLAYFLFFGLGFGWPLVLLVGIALLGIWVDLVPLV